VDRAEPVALDVVARQVLDVVVRLGRPATPAVTGVRASSSLRFPRT
jgi:hypothetical protein